MSLHLGLGRRAVNVVRFTGRAPAAARPGLDALTPW